MGLVYKAQHVDLLDGGSKIFNEITADVKSVGGNAVIGLRMAESFMPDGKYHLLVYGTVVELEEIKGCSKNSN